MNNYVLNLTKNGADSHTSWTAYLWAALAALSVFAVVIQPTRGAVTEAWVQRYNGPANDNDYAQAAAVDMSGNVVVTGYSWNGTNFDYYTGKYAALDGALLWEKRYNGPRNDWDIATAVAVDGGGNVVVTGFSENGDFFSGNSDFLTIKYGAADGALLWENRYNGGGHDIVSGSRGLALGPGGLVAIAGSSAGTDSGYDYATIVYLDTLPSVSVQKVATGFRLLFPGVAGRTYQIQRSPTPTGYWTTNAYLTAVTNGPVEYIETNAPPGSAFYRTSTGP